MDWITIEELEHKYKENEEFLVRYSHLFKPSISDAVRHANKEIKEELKRRGHHGFDFNQ